MTLGTRPQSNTPITLTQGHGFVAKQLGMRARTGRGEEHEAQGHREELGCSPCSWLGTPGPCVWSQADAVVASGTFALSAPRSPTDPAAVGHRQRSLQSRGLAAPRQPGEDPAWSPCEISRAPQAPSPWPARCTATLQPGTAPGAAPGKETRPVTPAAGPLHIPPLGKGCRIHQRAARGGVGHAEVVVVGSRSPLQPCSTSSQAWCIPQQPHSCSCKPLVATLALCQAARPAPCDVPRFGNVLSPKNECVLHESPRGPRSRVWEIPTSSLL